MGTKTPPGKGSIRTGEGSAPLKCIVTTYFLYTSTSVQYRLKDGVLPPCE